MIESSSVVQDMKKLLAASRKKKDDSLNPNDLAGFIPLHQQSFPMGSKPNHSSSMPSSEENHAKALELAASIVAVAGGGTEASGELVAKTFSNLKQELMLPSQNNRLTTLSLLTSPGNPTPKLVNIQNGKESKKLQPKTTKKRSSNDENKKAKKRKLIKGKSSTLAFSSSNFTTASSHRSGAELLVAGTKEYNKSLTQEQKGNCKILVKADRSRFLAKEHALTESQSNPNTPSSLMYPKESNPHIPVPVRTQDGDFRALSDQKRLLRDIKTLPNAGHSVGIRLDESATLSSRQHEKTKVDFLPACFHARPPVDPLCTLPHCGSLDFEHDGNIGSDGKRVQETNQKQGKQQRPFPLQKKSFPTFHQANPHDTAKNLLHEFLNQYGVFWPFQYWILHQMESSQNAKINPDSRQQQGVLLDRNLPIYMYYHDPYHPFRKFFHPCSSAYLSVMENLADKLARQIHVLEAFRSLAHDVAFAYPSFRDGLHYVLQHADAKAFQPLLGVPEFHLLSSSEAIYYGTRS
ncbi:unnamed protein product [Cylindrotheca closterium]|uniref:Uncharacterized protein n=1 Tax=Cylindrotheca closterium TaxID=2856 RepID=A0AAD2JKK2_9STRA|nr:unnamed protein product [Cylindrotheca closterium]